MMTTVKTIAVALMVLCVMSGCSGFRYSMVEDNDRYLLIGEYYNNNPLITVKAYLPRNYLVEKAKDHLSKQDDVYIFLPFKSGRSQEHIQSGYIIDRGKRVEIHLKSLNPYSREIEDRAENGTYHLTSRTAVEDVCEFVSQHYPWLQRNDASRRGCGISR